MEDRPIVLRSKFELRDLFNEGGYESRVAAGLLTERIVDDSHPAAPLAAEPYCTRSQMIEYVTPKGRAVALFHQYLRPDGKIGLSGLRDPKMVLHRGVEHILLQDDP